MSHTIRNERTKGFLDHLARQRKTRKMIREVKNDEVFLDLIDDLDAPLAQDE